MQARSTAIAAARLAVLVAPEIGVELVAGGSLAPGVGVLAGARARPRPSLRAASRAVSASSSVIYSACGEGTRKAPLGGFGRRSEGDLARQARPRHVRPQHVLQRDHVRGRLDPLEVELADPVDVLEDPRELAGHLLDLLLGEAEAGQPGHVQYLLALDHRPDSRRAAGSSLLASQPVRVPAMQGPRGGEIRRAQPAAAGGQLRRRRHPLHRRAQRRPRRDLRRRRMVRQRHPRPAHPGVPLAGARLRLHGRDHRHLPGRPDRRRPLPRRCCSSSPPARPPPRSARSPSS